MIMAVVGMTVDMVMPPLSVVKVKDSIWVKKEE